MAASSGGLDGTGYTYSADALPANFSWAGIPFLPNAIDMSNAVSSGIMIAPSGSFTSLRLLGTAPGGDQTAQPFTVTTSTVNLSDWCARSPASGETQIVYSFYRDIGLEKFSCPVESVFGYVVPLDSSRSPQSPKLPNNRNVVILGVTLQ